MRFYEFAHILLEDRLDFLRSKYVPILDQYIETTVVPVPIRSSIGQLSGENIFNWIVSKDPTRKKIYVQWLLKGVTRSSNPIELEDVMYADEDLSKFEEAKRSLEPNQRDINKYKTLSDVAAVTRSHDQSVVSSNQEEEDAARSQSDIFYEDANWVIATPRTVFAAQYWGRGSEWCTAWGDPSGRHPKRKNMFDQYVGDHLYSCINKENRPESIQMSFEHEQFMDWNDRVIPRERIQQLTRHPVIGRVFKNPQIKTNPRTAYVYAKVVIGGRWPEAERYIIKDTEYAYKYAQDVIQGRWPEVEIRIMKDPESAYQYAAYIIKGRWPEAESSIITDPTAASKYAQDVIQGRWPKAESSIITDPTAAHQYAVQVLNKRWPEAEPIIMKEPKLIPLYATFVIHGRWPEAEKYIIKDPELAHQYAFMVLRSRWPEAEPYIKADPQQWELYKNNQRFKSRPTNDLENQQ